MNDFSVHRIIGRGGFGEVYGCRKADTGKMYAMKCLDKKRIKMKQGETLALNERIMLSLVSTGVSLFFFSFPSLLSYSSSTQDLVFDLRPRPPLLILLFHFWRRNISWLVLETLQHSSFSPSFLFYSSSISSTTTAAAAAEHNLNFFSSLLFSRFFNHIVFRLHFQELLYSQCFVSIDKSSVLQLLYRV